MTSSAQTMMQNLIQPSPEEREIMLAALQPVYAVLVREFVIEVGPCPVDEPGLSSAESHAEAEAWLQKVDSQVQVHQLRQFLQTTPLASEAVLRHLLTHHMGKGAKSASDRDKVDFLLVQYFSLCAASIPGDDEIELDSVGRVLEPVLGPPQASAHVPEWLNSLETILQSAARSRRLSELLHSGTLEQGRKLKTQNASRYFEPAALVAFARFNFKIRRIFFRLMHDDLNAIQDGLRELERRGVGAVDCRRAQFSAGEPIARLRMICQSWKVMFHAEYSSGQPLRMLVDLRAAIDDALQNGAVKNPNPAPTAASAAAGSGAGTKK